jgi:hypothetical protein
MEKCLPKLSKAAPAAMYGFFILLCLPFVWQQLLLSSQPVSAIEPKFVPKSGIEKQNLFGGIACLNEVRVSLGVNCTFQVTSNLVAEYNNADCPGATFELIISDQNAKAIPNNLLTGEHAGQRLKYFLRRVGCDEAGCWGILVVEDKNVPRIDSAWFDPTPVICSKVDYILNNPQTIGKLGRTSSPLQIPAGTINYRSEVQDKVPNLGLVKFSNCDPDCPLSVKWSDKLEVYGCDSLSKNGLYARILRTWVATNCVGMRADTVQVINFVRPAVSDFRFNGAGSDEYDRVVTYTSCTPNKKLIRSIDVTPFTTKTRGTVTDTLFLDQQACNYSMQIKDQEFPICNNRGLKIDREIYVFDWCKGEIVKTFHVLIKIGDFDAPTVITPHHPIELSTGPMNCDASFPVTIRGLKEVLGVEVTDNCSVFNVSVKVESKRRYVKGILIAEKGDNESWFEEEYPVVNGVMSGLTLGKHRVIVDAFDGCYNGSKDTVLITVVDKISPVMIIDDQLNVSLSNANGYIGGYAKVCVDDVNEGSSDNCQMLWMRVRRNVPAGCEGSFINKGYDTNGNGKLDPLPADNDWAKADGFDLNGDGELDDFGETFILKGGKLMTPLQNCADFFCCDLPAKVTIELWGEDISGNRNFAWAEIQLEDKVIPACVAPWDLTVDCDEKCLATIDSKTASVNCFGDVTITSGNDCAPLDTVYSTEKSLKCGYGYILRKWTLTKKTSKGPITIVCTQKITINGIHEYNISFPKDANQKACNKPVVDSLIKDELGCDLLSVNVSDKRYDASDDECYKIFRTYTVLNWCTYDDRCGDPMATGNVYVVDRSTFNNYGKAPIYLLVRDADRDLDEEFYLSKDLTPDNDNDISFTPPKCTYGEYFHSFMYTQIIKVYDEELPVVLVPVLDKIPTRSTDCKADAIITFKASDNCTDKVELERAQLMIAPFQTLDAGKMIPYEVPRWIVRENKGNSYQVTIRDLPEGKHDLIVVVRDECGNLSVPTRIPFEIRDCKGPAPICINGLATDLMPDGNGGGMMTVWANDFIGSKIFDCNGQGPETFDGQKLVTKYSVNREGENPNPNQTSLQVTCADAGLTISVEVHGWDELGNHDFCLSYLLVQDNRKICPEGSALGGEINGLIATDDTEPLAGVSVEISGNASKQQPSGATGKYAFANLKKGTDYTIAPQLDRDHLNGVSTFDLVLIQKHILGTQPLSNPYRIIAADVNNSKSITTLDLIQIRKLILNIDQRLNGVPSWKFVDGSYKFSNPANPWQAEMPQVVNINNLQGKVNADFVAIKMGDVNGNASTNAGAVANGELRNDRVFNIQAEIVNQARAAFQAGEIFAVALKAKDLAKVQGYQFTLNFDLQMLDLENIEYRTLKSEHLGVFANQGDITVSWNKQASQSPDQTLLILQFKAKKTGAIQDVLQLNGRRTPAEAYNWQDEAICVQLEWGNQGSNLAEAVLRQNTPNPFKDETLIEFSLPKATQATLSIRDVAGRLLWTNQSWFAQGENRVQIKSSALQGNGVLYYTLDAEGFTATKKMIILE